MHTNSRTHNISQGSSPDLNVQLTRNSKSTIRRYKEHRLKSRLPLCDLEIGPASFDSTDSEENQVSDIRTSYSCLIEPNYTPMVAAVAITGYQFTSPQTAMTEISIEFTHGFQSWFHLRLRTVLQHWQTKPQMVRFCGFQIWFPCWEQLIIGKSWETWGFFQYLSIKASPEPAEDMDVKFLEPLNMVRPIVLVQLWIAISSILLLVATLWRCQITIRYKNVVQSQTAQADMHSVSFI